MLRSLAVVGVIIVPLWLLIPHHAKQTVTVIDYSNALSQAERLSQQAVLVPTGLPATWRATSVSTSGGSGKPVLFHLGYVTPAGDYAALEESTGPADAFLVTLLGKKPVRLGDVPVGGAGWRSLMATDGRVTLVSPTTSPTVVVKGTASTAELTALAASLR